MLAVVEVPDDGRELVAAHPGRERALREHVGAEADADLAQHLVGVEVPEVLVEAFHAVEVHEEQREGLADPGLHRRLEQLAEVAVVPQTGEVVGECLAPQPGVAARRRAATPWPWW